MSCSERMSRKVEWVLWFLEKMNLCLHRCGNGEWEDHSESLIKPLRGVGTICRGMKYSALGWVEVGDHFHSFISQIIIEDLLGIICLVKHLPAIQETWVRFLGWEESLEKEMATHYSTLAWRIPWTEEPGGLQSMGLQRARHDWATNTHTHCWVSGTGLDAEDTEKKKKIGRHLCLEELNMPLKSSLL